MFTGFPEHWTTLKKLMFAVGSGIAGAASGIWKTVTGTLLHITDSLASPMQKCEVTLEPIQDLHGQDAPYPAGGGINIFDGDSFGEYFPISLSVGDKISCQCVPSDSNAYLVLRTYDSEKNFLQSITTTQGTSSIKYNQLTISQTAGGASFFRIERSSSSITYNDIMVVIGNVTLPLTYSPYSNICPITGWTGCEVTRTGKNLINQETAEIFYRYFAGDGEQGFNWKYSPDSRGFAFPCIPNQIYTVSTTDPNLTIFRVGYIKDELPQSTSVSPIIYDVTRKSSDGSITLNPSSDATYIVIQLGQSRIRSANLQIEFGSTASSHEPYSGTTLSVTFPDSTGTVYGGTYDFVSGNGISKMASVDLGTLTWSVASSAQSGKGRFTATLAGAKLNLNTETVPNIKCSELKPITPTQAFNNNDGITISASSEIVIAYVDSLARESAANFKTAMSGVQLVYELATPIEIQLTPQEISTLKGENNVWGDGNIELTYKAQSS